LAGGGWVGEVRFEVHQGYTPSDDFDAEELARAVGSGDVLFPERDTKFVTAYGPTNAGESLLRSNTRIKTPCSTRPGQP
jgi:hypothetical protein